MNWDTVIIENDEIKTLLNEIQNELKREKWNKNTSLLSGSAGILLFLYYYQNYANDGVEQYCEQVIEGIFDSINSGYSYPTFAGGLAGIAWTFQHLTNYAYIDVDCIEPLLGLGGFLKSNHELEFTEKAHYDYMHGALGYQLTMMNSHLRTKSISKTLLFLDKTALRTKEGIAWISTPKFNSTQKVNNLSLSHGLASIIQILGKIQKSCKGDELAKCKELLSGAVRYLLSTRQEVSIVGSYFPSWIVDDQVPSYSRLAWCYGDLGIAMALLQAGINTENVEWKGVATEILLHTAKRRDLETNLVKDAGLCHGASGIAHCFNRAYNYTNRIEFKEASVHWFEEIFKMARSGDGLSGFRAWRTEEQGGWTNEYGLLEGIAGIGLSLISAIAPVEPRWDECLLLS